MAASSLRQEIRDSKLPFYVYVLSRPDGTPFYVGKGQGGRLFDHEREAKGSKSRNHKLSVIRKILKAGGSVVTSIDSYHASNEAACAREIEMILQLGRADIGTGPLTNCTSGGDTPVIGPESRKRMSAATTKYFSDPAARARTSEATKKYLREHPEALIALSGRLRAYFAIPKNLAKHAATVKEYFATNPQAGPEHSKRLKQWRASNPELVNALEAKRCEALKRPDVRQKMAAANIRWRKNNPVLDAARQLKVSEKRSSVEGRKKNSDALLAAHIKDPTLRIRQRDARKRWAAANPELAELHKQKRSAATRTAESRKKLSASLKKTWEDPQFRLKHKERMRAVHGTAEARQRNSERQKKRFADRPQERHVISEKMKQWTQQNPEARAEQQRKRAVTLLERRAIRLRCLQLAPESSLPDPRASLAVWQAMERELQMEGNHHANHGSQI